MLHVVTHCFCPPGMEFYATLLFLHGQSIARAATLAGEFATLWIVRHEEDRQTAAAVAAIEREQSNFFAVHDRAVDGCHLFRRAIMRQKLLAEISHEHRMSAAIWLADCDYLIDKNFFASVREAVKAGPCYPRQYKICRNHALGDRLIASWRNGLPPRNRAFKPHLYLPERPPRAVGGMMFLPQEAAARVGYVPDYSRWLRPTHWTRFQTFGCDIAHRRHLNSLGCPYRPATIAGLYRLRHSKAGYKNEFFSDASASSIDLNDLLSEGKVE